MAYKVVNDASDIPPGNGDVRFGLRAILSNSAEDALELQSHGPMLWFTDFDALWAAFECGGYFCDQVKAEINIQLKNLNKGDKDNNDWHFNDCANASKLEWRASRKAWEEVASEDIGDSTTKDWLAKALGVTQSSAVQSLP